MKQNVNVDANEIRAILKEYEFNEEEDKLNCDDKLYYTKKALSEIDVADRIIFCLYLQLQSERKVAALLGVSRTPVSRILRKIKDEIREKINGYVSEFTADNSDNRVCD